MQIPKAHARSRLLTYLAEIAETLEAGSGVALLYLLEFREMSEIRHSVKVQLQPARAARAGQWKQDEGLAFLLRPHRGYRVCSSRALVLHLHAMIQIILLARSLMHV